MKIVEMNRETNLTLLNDGDVFKFSPNDPSIKNNDAVSINSYYMKSTTTKLVKGEPNEDGTENVHEAIVPAIVDLETGKILYSEGDFIVKKVNAVIEVTD